MKTKQEHIDDIAPHMCFVCEMNTGFCECIQHGNELCGMAYESADRIYKAGYRKASDVIDEFVDRIMNIVRITYCAANGKDYYEIEVNKFNKLMDEMRQEVEK